MGHCLKTFPWFAAPWGSFECEHAVPGLKKAESQTVMTIMLEFKWTLPKVLFGTVVQNIKAGESHGWVPFFVHSGACIHSGKYLNGASVIRRNNHYKSI